MFAENLHSLAPGNDALTLAPEQGKPKTSHHPRVNVKGDGAEILLP